MGENSAISWTDHTFNPWIGCTKVSPGCANCYAERDMDHRHGKAKWGKGQPRVRTVASTWAQPLKWDRAAAKAGRRDRVFCASLADVFDPEVPIEWLADLLALIDQCPHLDWLLLTKRPQLIAERCDLASHGNGAAWNFAKHMPNVWLGTSVEDQQRAETRIPELLKVPAAKHFLSCEPLLGPVDLTNLRMGTCEECGTTIFANAIDSNECCSCCVEGPEGLDWRKLDWIIVGGESGPQARPMHPAWARGLRDQASSAGIAFHFKQWGEWFPIDEPWKQNAPGRLLRPSQQWLNRAGGQGFHGDEVWRMERVGKTNAGRMFEGRTWDEVPTESQQTPTNGQRADVGGNTADAP
jgi:protein gp37